MPQEDRATDIGNVHKKFAKDRACGSADILADRQTDSHTDRPTDRHVYSSQYFATAPAGEVIINLLISQQAHPLQWSIYDISRPQKTAVKVLTSGAASAL